MESDLPTVLVFLLLAGSIAGLLAGLFGVGGGAILVPVLDMLFLKWGVPLEIRMHMAVGTSLAIIIPTSWRSYQAHKARDAVLMPILKRWASPVILGVIMGTLLAAMSTAGWLRGIFAAMAIFNGAKLLLGRDHWRLSDALPPPVGMRAYGFVIGLLSAMMGIGGGVFSSMVLTLHNIPIHRAVATASGVGVLIAIPAAIGFMITGSPVQHDRPEMFPWGSIGYVQGLAVLGIAPISAVMAPFGARIAHGLSREALSCVFGLFLLLVAAKMLLA